MKSMSSMGLIYVVILGSFVAGVGCGSSSAESVQLFVVAGQSNAVGTPRSTGLPDRLTDQADVLFWSGSRFRALRPTGGTFGPELTLGRTLADALPTVAIVKVAVGGTTLSQRAGNDWSPDSSGELFDRLISNIGSAMSSLQDDGKTPILEGLFWMQGESDGKSGNLGGGQTPPPQPQTADAYEANLTEFIARLRSDLAVADLPVFVGQVKIGDDPSIITDPDSNFNTLFGEWDGTPTIQAAQNAVAMADPRSYLVPTDSFSLGDDFLHFDQAGQLDLGKEFANAYLQSVPEPNASRWLIVMAFVMFVSVRKR